MYMNKEQVMRFLPHRDPFLFIDSVKEVILPEELKGQKGPFTPAQLIGGKSICNFRVDDSVKVLEGHFPGNPILPGVVQVEMMAQAASFLCISTLTKPIEETNLTVALISVDSARFRKPIVPTMDLEIHSVLTKVRGPFQMYDCEIYVAGELMSQCSVMASLKID
ncbi:3-hydroxyacyl-ACP dehydratase FabZ family protein [Peredibacter sp. HCB2-198]|uniref:3-hydroxyacyl-ACP dehydratase FabZ family protein n=1 Tax=Peredibacter sp. HCB2-198 TaxID=3383025 RepID=UPI0038B47034